MMMDERRYRKKKLKEIDPEEYEDEVWLAFVEPQYENEYSRLLATHRSGNPMYRKVQTKEEYDRCIEDHREKIKEVLKVLNPNVEVPEPKLIEIKKVAIGLDEYDHLRNAGMEVANIPRPAP